MKIRKSGFLVLLQIATTSSCWNDSISVALEWKNIPRCMFSILHIHFIRSPLFSNLFSQHLDLLLSQICVIVEKHTDANVLQACAHLASTLCSESYTFSSRAHLAFNQLLDDLTDCFSTYSNNLVQVRVCVHEAYILANTAIYKMH